MYMDVPTAGAHFVFSYQNDKNIPLHFDDH